MTDHTTHRGGPRPGSGRKPHGYRSISITLPPEHIAYLESLGHGNISQGVRSLVSQAIAQTKEPSHDQPA